MPSPNGFFDCGAVVDTARESFRMEVTHDTTAAPFPSPLPGGWTFEVNVGTAAGGPFTPAMLSNSPVDPCAAVEADNFVPIGNFGGGTQTQVHIVGLNDATPYFVEWVLYDETNTEQDRFVCEHTTASEPAALVCLGSAVSDTEMRMRVGWPTGRANSNACNADQIAWQWGTTAGGPYPNTVGPTDLTDNIAEENVTGLTCGTTYYFIGTLTDPDGTMNLVSPECEVTTDACATTVTCGPTSAITDTSANLRIDFTKQPGEFHQHRYGTTPGGPYPNQSPSSNAPVTSEDWVATGLTPGTDYYYVGVILDGGGTVLAQSTECTFRTTEPANMPPTITGVEDQTGPINTPQTDDFMVADGDGTVDTVTVAPAGATLIDNGGGNWTINYTPTAVGPTTFTITATDDDGATATQDITFTGTAQAAEDGGAAVPADCDEGGGGGGADVEISQMLCVTDQNGERIATVMREYEYDDEGERVGQPRLVDAATGDVYTPPAGATVGPCSDSDCGSPKTFCFRSTNTVDEQGRMYDLTLNHAQGFEVESLIIDLIEYPLGVSWDILDIDGSEFVAELQQAIQSQFRGDRAATVTVTPPADLAANGTCGEREPFEIHIECIALTDEPPTLVQLTHNAGQDLIQNPAYNEVGGPLNELCGNGDEADQGGSWRAPRRVDDGGTLRCTDVAGRGWESNDAGLGDGPRFEVWCNPGFTSANNVTPTPRGTPVQEINAFGASDNPGDGINNGDPDTIWQTFIAPASGPFTIEAVVGGRGVTENFQISLTVGDTDDNQIGDVLFDSIDAPNVLNRQNPWTVYERVVNLNAGQTYTLALRGPVNAPPNATGGLFTDLRAYQDLPGTRRNFVNDDDTCTVSKTTTTITSAEWSPICGSGGNNPGIQSWRRASDGLELTNAQFWAQEPAPTDCNTARAEAESSVGNLTHTYAVCGEVNGIRRTLQRVVVSDQSGGVIQSQFLDTDGSPVTPDSWQPGECGTDRDVEEQLICADGLPGLRRIQFVDGQPQTPEFFGANGAVIPVPTMWTYGDCTSLLDDECLTDDNGVFFRRVVRGDDGTLTVTTVDAAGDAYVPVGEVGPCSEESEQFDFFAEKMCDSGQAEFIRFFRINAQTGAVETVTDVDESGAAYNPVGQVTLGGCDEPADRERICYTLTSTGTTVNVGWARHQDSIPNTPITPNGMAFFDATGNIIDPTADGFTQVVCQNASVDVEEQIVCANTTANEATPGANPVSLTKRTTYTDGVPAAVTFWDGDTQVNDVTSWTLGDCVRDVEIVEVCITDGGQRFAGQRVNVYDRTGAEITSTLRRYDGVAVPVTATSVVGACPTEIRVQARIVDDTNPWTPAEVTAGGVINSVTMTVLAGTARLTDFNGTVSDNLPAGLSASWIAEDANLLDGPQEILANTAGRVFVTWTEKVI